MKEIEPPFRLVWWIFPGVVLVQLGWKGWILCPWWTNFGPFHREDGRILPPWKGCSPSPSNSKSDACPEYSERNSTPGEYKEENEDEEVSKGSIH